MNAAEKITGNETVTCTICKAVVPIVTLHGGTEEPRVGWHARTVESESILAPVKISCEGSWKAVSP